MTTHSVITTREQDRDETSSVVEWRRGRLQEAGFDPPLAARLAATSGVDVHELLDLVHRGCPPDLAARILSPVSDPVP